MASAAYYLAIVAVRYIKQSAYNITPEASQACNSEILLNKKAVRIYNVP